MNSSPFGFGLEYQSTILSTVNPCIIEHTFLQVSMDRFRDLNCLLLNCLLLPTYVQNVLIFPHSSDLHQLKRKFFHGWLKMMTYLHLTSQVV